MVQFRKRKSDGQSFPIGSTKKIRASNPSNDVGGLKLGKGIKLPEISSGLAGEGLEATTFFQGGKAFKVELDESLGIISVDERFQDSNNVWHTGKNIFFAQGEDGQEIADKSGGFFVNTIMAFLDSAGALEGAR